MKEILDCLKHSSKAITSIISKHTPATSVGSTKKGSDMSVKALKTRIFNFQADKFGTGT